MQRPQVSKRVSLVANTLHARFTRVSWGVVLFCRSHHVSCKWGAGAAPSSDGLQSSPEGLRIQDSIAHILGQILFRFALCPVPLCGIMMGREGNPNLLSLGVCQPPKSTLLGTVYESWLTTSPP